MKNFILAFLFSFFLFCNSALATTSYSAPVLITATATSTLVMPANAFRIYLLIVNTGSNPVIVKLGSVQSALEGIPIPAGGSYEPIQAPGNGVWIETASSTSTVTLVQGIAE